MAGPADATRVPTTERQGWSTETAVDHLLAIISASERRYLDLIAGLEKRVVDSIELNDRRYEERFSASQKALELGLAGTKSEISVALAASKEAVLKAENATEKRFESVNEFRGTLDNQQRTLIPRSEVDALMRGVDTRISQLTKDLDKMEQDIRSNTSERMGIKGGWGYAVGVLGFVLLIVSIAARFMK